MKVQRTRSAVRRWQPILAGIALMATPSLLFAQRATVTGRVTEQSSGAPLADSRVFLVGTSAVTSTNADGRYTLRNVPAGDRSRSACFASAITEQKKSVTRRRGTDGDARLRDDSRRSCKLPGNRHDGHRRTAPRRARQRGRDARRRDQNASRQTPITNMADLMVAKAPGVDRAPWRNDRRRRRSCAFAASNSLSLSNDPIYMIDGVRMNDGQPLDWGSRRHAARAMLNDLDPNEIEDIEIVKGPSAATLYGTDAANGVIVITTKKGRAGSTRWTWYGEDGNGRRSQQVSEHVRDRGATRPADDGARAASLVRSSQGTCIARQH